MSDLVKIKLEMKPVLDVVNDAIEQALWDELGVVMNEAQALCPVGDDERGTRSFTYKRNSKKKKIELGSKFAISESGARIRKPTGSATAWTARKPGTLRDSIFRRTRVVDDAWVGWVKAGYSRTFHDGDPNAFYAHFVEFGTKKIAAQPFMRPALSKANPDRIAQALAQVLGKD
jgi:HK97 gp10 family phage protein